MSMLADFYVLKAEDTEPLAVLAERVPPKKRILGIFPRRIIDTKDDFWAFMDLHAQTSEKFDYSGFAVLELFGIYPQLTKMAEDQYGFRLTKAMGNSFVSFNVAGAETVLEILGEEPPDETTIRGYLKAEGREGEFHDCVEPIRAAWNILRIWLKQVGPGTVGLLSLG